MLNWKKMYGNAWSNTLSLWWNVALWPTHVYRVWKVAISFSNLNFSHVECFTSHYQALQTWVGHDATRYHNFNALPHALSYIFHDFPVFGLFTTGYHDYRQLFLKNIYILFFINLTVKCGNALEIAPKTC